ncbi:hypothetical protein V8F20_011103 [Naviculisporaceae sp. PSN 640]
MICALKAPSMLPILAVLVRSLASLDCCCFPCWNLQPRLGCCRQAIAAKKQPQSLAELIMLIVSFLTDENPYQGVGSNPDSSRILPGFPCLQPVQTPRENKPRTERLNRKTSAIDRREHI